VVHSEEMQLQRHAYPASPNTMSIEKLLLGFFKYYSSAELRDMVICPLLGKLLPRRVFEPDHLDELPQELDAYRR
jgi:Poly(A) polymerase.